LGLKCGNPGSGVVVPHAAWSFSATRETPMQARRVVLDWARRHVEDRAVLSDLALAVTEAATNAVLHAYRDREEPGTVIIDAERFSDHVCIAVRDEGTGLSPRVDSPGLGLGLGLIAQVADSADVRAPESGGTEVVMRFNLERAIAS
jgi:anti-sigma regulatory factor (Ser/Thr protein kinase)